LHEPGSFSVGSAAVRADGGLPSRFSGEGTIPRQGSSPAQSESQLADVRSRRIRYVCMPGSPYTGSTLLGSILNNHPACASIGAATGLSRIVELPSYRCSCGKLFRECEFWSHIAARTAALGHPVDIFQTGFWNTHLRVSRNRLLNVVLVRSLARTWLNDARDAVVKRVDGISRAVSDMGWNTWSLAAAVLEQTGKAVFVDTARDHQRPKYLATHPLLDVRVIHLIRDPRGTSASMMKNMGLDVAVAARRWKWYNVEADRTRRYLPADSWMTLRYEDLCADPAGVMDRISDFMGVDRAPMPDSLRGHDQHIIGNPMRLKALGEIREDRSWQERLSPSDLAVIAKIVGPTSRRFAYDWP